MINMVNSPSTNALPPPTTSDSSELTLKKPLPTRPTFPEISFKTPLTSGTPNMVVMEDHPGPSCQSSRPSANNTQQQRGLGQGFPMSLKIPDEILDTTHAPGVPLMPRKPPRHMMEDGLPTSFCPQSAAFIQTDSPRRRFVSRNSEDWSCATTTSGKHEIYLMDVADGDVAVPLPYLDVDSETPSDGLLPISLTMKGSTLTLRSPRNQNQLDFRYCDPYHT